MNIEDEIREYIVNELLFDRKDATLSNDDELLEKRIVDSMALVQLISFIEDQYGIDVEDDELILENFKTINHIRDFILRKREQTE
ncbi:MAG: acyl carrier protein [Planctomycetota bacterium]|jgi:acyl carrier protein